MVLDVTDEASVAAAVDVLVQAGGLDVLVNNAGIAGARTDARSWRRSCSPGFAIGELTALRSRAHT